MFKFIFKSITLFFFLIFLIVSLSIWKGGEPFRWVGDGLIIMGETIKDFGDSVDDFIKGSKEVRENVEKIKEVISPDKD
jgi:hypothetical protein